MKTRILQACPFCGSEAKQPEDISVKGYGPWWQVMCGNEQCRAWRPGATPAKAAAEWNKRAGDRKPEANQIAGNIAGSFQRLVKRITPLTDKHAQQNGCVDAELARQLEVMCQELATELELEQNPHCRCGVLRDWDKLRKSA